MNGSTQELRNDFLPVSDLRNGSSYDFDIQYSKSDLVALATALDVVEVTKLTFKGTVSPLDKIDWQLIGTLGATVVQECVVTLAPVKSRIDAKILRNFRKNTPQFEANSTTELDWPDDDDELGEGIDLTTLIMEGISLNLEDFPRAEGVSLEQAQFTEPGKAPLTDDDVKPFAGLAELKAKLQSDKE